MARIYDIPPNTKEEEKAIGGVITFIQFFWLLGSIVLGLCVYLLFYIFIKMPVVCAIPAIIVAMVGIPFAFVKKKEMTLFTYLKRKIKFKKKNKKLINRR